MKYKILTIAICIMSLGVWEESKAQVTAKKIEVKSGSSYINFPVAESSELKKTRIIADGKVIDEFTIGIAEGEPDYWVFFDASNYVGKSLTIEAENLEKQQTGFEKIYADKTFPGKELLYKEEMRPQVHFSSQRGWLNDPNGLVFYNGEYHLFYQHNPYGWKWGNMHWGHAVSTDLLHWKQLPEALYTPSHSDMAFSGTATTDPQNTSGFKKNGVNPLIAIFTSTGRGESLALSYDNGRTFSDYEDNPVVKHKGRDPKVFWYEPGKHWVMVVYDESHKREIAENLEAMAMQFSIYTSPDMKNWTYQSAVSGLYECPDLFELEVAGEPGVKKWVLYAADGKYKVGSFDGKKFTEEQNLRTYDNGTTATFYASQTFNNIPEKDGRRIQIGWARIPIDGMPFNQCMAFPTSLSLKKSFDGYRLCPTPVKEIKTLYKNSHIYTDKILSADSSVFVAPVQGDVLHIIAEFDGGDSRQFGLNINGYEIAYDNLFNQLNKINYPVDRKKPLKIEAIIDKAIIEIFVNDGEMYAVSPLNSVKANKEIKAFAHRFGNNSKSLLKKLEVHELSSIWPTSN